MPFDSSLMECLDLLYLHMILHIILFSKPVFWVLAPLYMARSPSCGVRYALSPQLRSRVSCLPHTAHTAHNFLCSTDTFVPRLPARPAHLKYLPTIPKRLELSVLQINKNRTGQSGFPFGEEAIHYHLRCLGPCLSFLFGSPIYRLLARQETEIVLQPVPFIKDKKTTFFMGRSALS